MIRTIAMLAFMLTAAFAAPSQAMTVERIVSPSGIEAWLVRDKAAPLVAMS